MAGNSFAPDAVARAIELVRSGIDPHEAIRREFSDADALGRVARNRYRAW
jgi:hypothetical protein